MQPVRLYVGDQVRELTPLHEGEEIRERVLAKGVAHDGTPSRLVK